MCGTEEEMSDESMPVADRIKILVNRLRQEIVDQDNGSVNVPEEILEAFVDHIVVHESSFDWYLRCTGNDEWDNLIYDGPDSDLGMYKRISFKGYYGCMPSRGNQKNNAKDEIYEDIHENEQMATEIMTFVLTREQAEAFREKMGKRARKIRWEDIKVRVFV